MSSVRRPDMEKLWTLVAVAMVLASVTIAVLLLGDTSAPVSATPPAAGPSYQAADNQVPPEPAEAEQTPADQTPREPAAPYQNPDDPTADQLAASEMPRPEASPAPQPGVTQDSESSPPISSEQSVFKSRRALETVDPRELLRQAQMSK